MEINVRGKIIESKKRFINSNKEINSYRWVVWGLLVTIYLIVFFHRLSIGFIRAFIAFVISSVIALSFALLTTETKCKNIYVK